jgi:hypothetical protein
MEIKDIERELAEAGGLRDYTVEDLDISMADSW